ncbi:SsrA-binding protein [Candidatus Parcubacteria bacterium 4484_255]|nr:MAG: SsrA-binding protein [Candidatus Parcubacteria bacterium 4484_255]
MRVIAKNKKVLYNYEILDTFEAGIVLTGPEVKSIKNGRINLAGSYIMVDSENNVYLLNARIAPYPPAFQVQQDYNPRQNRKLLLKKKEIQEIIGKTHIVGLSAIPLKIYTKGNIIKVEIAIAKGKKKYDKRQSIKEKDIKKRISQKLKNSFKFSD